MEYFFDGLIFAIILFCFISAKEPKQTALLVCLLVALTGHVINQYFAVEYLYSSMALVESFGAYLMLILARGVGEKNKKFFYLMSAFLYASVVNNAFLMPIYKYTDILTFQIYSLCYQSIAVCHVLVMLAYSDVIRDAVGSVRSLHHNHNAAVRDLRGDA